MFAAEDARAMFKQHFKRLKMLGEGAFGAAYLVQQRDEETLHVAKEIKIGHLTEVERQGALAEAETLRSMSHPNIVAYRTSFIDANKLYIVMEYADGGDLGMKIKERKEDPERLQHFSERRIMVFFVQIAEALQYIHHMKILHRDLKPMNIFLTKVGIVKLGDFGIARVLESSTAGARTTIGTPFYLSPEQCNNEAYGLKSDLWSLGVVTYELAALKVPFRASSLPAVAVQICSAHHEKLPMQYSKGLVWIVDQLLAKDPNERPRLIDVLRVPWVQQYIEYMRRRTENGNGNDFGRTDEMAGGPAASPMGTPGRPPSAMAYDEATPRSACRSPTSGRPRPRTYEQQEVQEAAREQFFENRRLREQARLRAREQGLTPRSLPMDEDGSETPLARARVRRGSQEDGSETPSSWRDRRGHRQSDPQAEGIAFGAAAMSPSDRSRLREEQQRQALERCYREAAEDRRLAQQRRQEQEAMAGGGPDSGPWSGGSAAEEGGPGGADVPSGEPTQSPPQAPPRAKHIVVDDQRHRLELDRVRREAVEERRRLMQRYLPKKRESAPPATEEVAEEKSSLTTASTAAPDRDDEEQSTAAPTESDTPHDNVLVFNIHDFQQHGQGSRNGRFSTASPPSSGTPSTAGSSGLAVPRAQRHAREVAAEPAVPQRQRWRAELWPDAAAEGHASSQSSGQTSARQGKATESSSQPSQARTAGEAKRRGTAKSSIQPSEALLERRRAADEARREFYQNLRRRKAQATKKPMEVEILIPETRAASAAAGEKLLDLDVEDEAVTAPPMLADELSAGEEEPQDLDFPAARWLAYCNQKEHPLLRVSQSEGPCTVCCAESEELRCEDCGYGLCGHCYRSAAAGATATPAESDREAQAAGDGSGAADVAEAENEAPATEDDAGLQEEEEKTAVEEEAEAAEEVEAEEAEEADEVRQESADDQATGKAEECPSDGEAGAQATGEVADSAVDTEPAKKVAGAAEQGDEVKHVNGSSDGRSVELVHQRSPGLASSFSAQSPGGPRLPIQRGSPALASSFSSSAQSPGGSRNPLLAKHPGRLRSPLADTNGTSSGTQQARELAAGLFGTRPRQSQGTGSSQEDRRNTAPPGEMLVAASVATSQPRRSLQPWSDRTKLEPVAKLEGPSQRHQLQQLLRDQQLPEDEVYVNTHPHKLARVQNRSDEWWCDDECENCSRELEGPSMRWSCSKGCGYDLCRTCVAHHKMQEGAAEARRRFSGEALQVPMQCWSQGAVGGTSGREGSGGSGSGSPPPLPRGGGSQGKSEGIAAYAAVSDDEQKSQGGFEEEEFECY